MAGLFHGGIIATGSYVPEKVITNHDLERIVDTSDEWIVTRTGIRERRIADSNTATSDLATMAARRALESARLTPQDIDMIVVATVTPDMHFPSTACLVQRNIGATNASAFDLEAACSGFLYGIIVANQFVATGLCRNVMVIGAECLSKFVNWKDRNTCVLFGDGAGAVIVSRVGEGYGFLSQVLGVMAAEQTCSCWRPGAPESRRLSRRLKGNYTTSIWREARSSSLLCGSWLPWQRRRYREPGLQRSRWIS